MLVDLSELQTLVGIYLLPLFRIAAMLMAMDYRYSSGAPACEIKFGLGLNHPNCTPAA